MQCITIILNTLQCFDFYEVIYNKETPIELQCKCFPPVVITAVLSYYEPNIFFHGREMVIMLSCQTLTNKSHIFLVRHEAGKHHCSYKHHTFVLTAAEVTLWECCIRSGNYLCIANIIFFFYCIL